MEISLMAPYTAVAPKTVTRRAPVRAGVLAAVAAGLLLSACGGVKLPFIGSDTTKASTAPQSIGVNGFLWRASLDTLGFLPLLTADPFGGVINYDWYTDPQAPNERFKATVFILDTRLRADALNVSVSKEVRGADGSWTPGTVAAQTETDLENAILTKARQLNLANAN
jgi:hypothetical protein